MTDKIYVWDKLIRVFHWTLASAFVISYLTGDELETVHVYSGYLILCLLVFRLIWGLIGTRHARFTSFVRAPSAAVRYVHGLFTGNSEHYIGHNPAGGLMVIALILSLGMTGVSGLKLYGAEGHGPLAVEQTTISTAQYSNREHYDDDSDEHHGDEDAEEFWEEIHEFFANFSVLLVLIHISGVFVSGLAHRENLVRAMITGYRDRKSD